MVSDGGDKMTYYDPQNPFLYGADQTPDVTSDASTFQPNPSDLQSGSPAPVGQQPTGQSGGGFMAGLKNTMANANQNPLLMAGLGILANQQYSRIPQNPIASVAQGAMQGLQAANQNRLSQQGMNIKQQEANQQGANINSEVLTRARSGDLQAQKQVQDYAVNLQKLGLNQQAQDLMKQVQLGELGLKTNAQNFQQNTQFPAELGIQQGTLQNQTNLANSNIATADMQRQQVQRQLNATNDLMNSGSLPGLVNALGSGKSDQVAQWVQNNPQQLGNLALAQPQAFNQLVQQHGDQVVPWTFDNNGKQVTANIPVSAAATLAWHDTMAGARTDAATIAANGKNAALNAGAALLLGKQNGAPGQQAPQSRQPNPAPGQTPTVNPAIQARIKQYQQQNIPNDQIVAGLKQAGVDPALYGLQ